jgi:hypothetical protein
MGLTKAQLDALNDSSFPNNNGGLITPQVLRDYNDATIVNTVNQDVYTADSASFNTRILASTGSATSTGSLLLTASFNNGTRNLTFTKGDASTFNVNIPDVSGSTINTGSFATTGSNTFIGNQIISGNVLPQVDGQGDLGSDSFKWNAVVVNGQLKGSSLNTTGRGTVGTIRVGDESFPLSFLADREIIGDGTGVNTHMYYATSSTDVNGLREFVYAQSGSDANFTSVSASFNTRINAAGGTTQVQDEGVILGNASSFNFNGAGVTATLSAGTASITIPGGGGSIDTGSFATTGSNTFRGTQTIITSNNIATIAADNGVAIGPTNGLGTGIATGAIRLLAQSGSLVLTNNSYTNTSASLSHLSASDNTLLANFIFRANVNSGTTQISGSGNIFTNPTTPTAGRVNYVGGATNLFLNGQGQQLPQITGSAASVSGNRPVMNGNIINGTQAWTINQAPNPGTNTYSNNIIAGNTGQWNFNMTGNTGTVNVNNNLGLSSQMTLNSPSRSVAEINAGASGSCILQIQNNTLAGAFTYNGPVSSSQHGINQNNIAGTLTLNMQSSSRALILASNIINGNMTMNDNTFNAGAIGSINSIQQNNINGTITLNQRASSSINLVNNNMNNWTVSNDLDASAVTSPIQRIFQVNGNALFGLLGNNLYASGSTSAISASRSFTNNLFAGQNISASLISDNSAASMIGTIGAGGGLSIEGTVVKDASNTLGNGATIGSAFFGRWNKTGQGFNTTGEVILAIGTGTSGSAGITRKTGFLIDSGSNSYFEGTLNVSGSTTFTGSVKVASTFQLQLPTGSNQQAGTAVLDGASPSLIVVSNSLVSANSIIMVSKQTLTNAHSVAVSSKGAGTFTISSSGNGDTDTVGWFVINNS